ncbi:MAG: YceI family protein [Acidobacteria bacterium]|nr:YceI family protein [Acidobacteriota bacterium]
MIRRTIVLIACLTVLVSVARPQTKSHTYTIVAGESSFWVFVPKTGLLSGLAHDHQIGIKSFTGKVVVPESGASGGSLELNVDTTSLVVLDTKPSEDDKKKIQSNMHNEVLESAKYPKASFKSVAVSDLKQTGGETYNFTLNGDLTLHGMTKRIAIPVSLTINAEQLRATGKYTLTQTDFGIKPYSAAGGTIKVKNEITVNFNIVAKA